MANYKLSYYQIFQPLNENIFLYSNFVTGKYILLSTKNHNILQNDCNTLKLQSPKIFKRLIEGGFLVKDDVDELKTIENQYNNDKNNQDEYHLIINPTLDCNLSCWYCYESKIKNSRMSETIVQAVCKNITTHYKTHPFKQFKLSFFGGEPFMRHDIMRELVSFANKFCVDNNVSLILDFTTNGTLITKSILEFLSDYTCIFQITLDGCKEQHNKIKFSKSNNIDAFSATINNIHRILQYIPKSYIAVRINFDKNTLSGFDSILKEIYDLDRCRTKVILKKVWQVDKDDISESEPESVLEKLLNANFIVDYYNQGGTCFADRKNQATINFDGNVFKCTTITNFDKENSLGVLNLSDGKIIWDENKTLYLNNNSFTKDCEVCKMLPVCGGPCRRQKDYWVHDKCFLNNIKMTIAEYALLQFKVQLIKQKIYETR